MPQKEMEEYPWIKQRTQRWKTLGIAARKRNRLSVSTITLIDTSLKVADG